MLWITLKSISFLIFQNCKQINKKKIPYSCTSAHEGVCLWKHSSTLSQMLELQIALIGFREMSRQWDLHWYFLTLTINNISHQIFSPSHQHALTLDWQNHTHTHKRKKRAYRWDMSNILLHASFHVLKTRFANGRDRKDGSSSPMNLYLLKRPLIPPVSKKGEWVRWWVTVLVLVGRQETALTCQAPGSEDKLSLGASRR